MFCQGLPELEAGHTRMECPVFRKLKRETSATPYIAAMELRPNDLAGYAAAGVLPWRRCSPSGGNDGSGNAAELEFLLAREYRPKSRDTGGDKLNFLGGKRIKKGTEALTCAVDKVHKETAGQLSPATMAHMRDGCPLVCWSSDSKYALFLFELVGESDRGVHVRCAGLPEAKRLEWVTRNELLDATWARREMHPYAMEMLRQLTSCSIMRRLEDLFDLTAASPNTPVGSASASGYQALNGGKTRAQVAKHFDITSSIRICLEAARPDHVQLSSNPSYTQLRNAVRAIPKRDLNKLKLRYHPDRLPQILDRPPITEESALSTSVMQILNGLVDVASGSEQDVMDGLKKVNLQCSQLLSATIKEGNKELESLLSRLSLGP
jgi:hypothetical protein